MRIRQFRLDAVHANDVLLRLADHLVGRKRLPTGTYRSAMAAYVATSQAN